MQHENSKWQGKLQETSGGNTNENSELTPPAVGSDLGMEKVLLPCLHYPTFPTLKQHPSSVWNYILCL